MNKVAYYMSGYTFKALTDISKAKIRVHGVENIPKGSLIFVINHFTRIETVFLPYYIHMATNTPVWSLASSDLFNGALSGFLNSVGAVSTKDPHRDLVSVKSLLKGDAAWIVFPEGRMVKNKKTINENGDFIIKGPSGNHRPHTGAAAMALRTSFYRERIRRMKQKNPKEFDRILSLFEIPLENAPMILENETFVVPVNVSYYPVTARDNLISWFAENIVEGLSARVLEELKVEGAMLFSGVDVDVRFGEALKVKEYLKNSFIESDLTSMRKIDFDDNICSKPVMKAIGVDLMNRYMTSIYKMTTINHGNIFASMLKALPRDIIEVDDFRRRIYLAITDDSIQKKNNIHESLKLEQITILTDDRFKQVEVFFTQAFDAGVLTEENGYYIRDATKFENRDPFHSVRIENPVSVMANEVESLEHLTNLIEEIASLSSEQIKIRLFGVLMQKAGSDFNRAYQKWFKPGLTKGQEIGSPFLLRGDSVTGVLLIHGYMAAPAEVRGIGDYLRKKGYQVYAPRLAGHGTSPEDLPSKSYTQWQDSVDEGYVLLKSLCDNVVVCGFSTGAGLALELAARMPEVRAVVAVSPPMKLHDFAANLVPAVDIWNKVMDKVSFDGVKKEFLENKPENPHINYTQNPVSGIRELERLMYAVAEKLPGITMPVLVVQSLLDPVVDPKGTKKLFDKLGSEEKECFLFSIKRHGILTGEGTKRVFRVIGDFIDNSISSPPGSGGDETISAN